MLAREPRGSDGGTDARDEVGGRMGDDVDEALRTSKGAGRRAVRSGSVTSIEADGGCLVGSVGTESGTATSVLRIRDR